MQHEPIRTHLKKKRAEKGIPVPLVKTFWTGVIDVAIYPIGVLSLLFTLPQVYDIWVLHQTAGVSLVTWGMWTISSFVWLIYGILHRAPAVAYMQAAWIAEYLLVITGVLIFH